MHSLKKTWFIVINDGVKFQTSLHVKKYVRVMFVYVCLS